MNSEKERPAAATFIACPDCDLLQQIPPLPPRGKARCRRCNRTLAVDKAYASKRTLALSLAAFIFFLIANLQPLMMLSAYGRRTETTIFGSVVEMWVRGYEITAVLVGFCAILAPAIYILFMLIINLLVLYPPAPWWIGVLLHWADRHQIWVMLEVMMLGILISLIKLSDIATMIPGVGMYAMGALIGLLAYIRMNFDPSLVWNQVQWVCDAVPSRCLPKHEHGVQEAET